MLILLTGLRSRNQLLQSVSPSKSDIDNFYSHFYGFINSNLSVRAFDLLPSASVYRQIPNIFLPDGEMSGLRSFFKGWAKSFKKVGTNDYVSLTTNVKSL
jgi:hypothetical protein